MMDTDKIFCGIMFDVLLQRGVRNVICSPGSRNVPLLLAAASRKLMKKHFVVDERSAAFLGLGISMVKQEPVALVCTSGTALLNYSPAIAEAYYQGLPLIIISADRPLQWIDQDDSQTIRQDNALNNFVKQSYSIPAVGDDNNELQWYVNRIVNDAVSVACDRKPGPVHINIHFEEPLNKKINKIETPTRVINSIIGDSIVNKEVIKDLAFQLSQAKVMLVTGFAQPDSALQKSLVEFSKFSNVAVFAESVSNLHFSEECFSIDSVLTSLDDLTLQKMAPDIIISLGGSLVSRKLKEFLRKNRNICKNWAIGYSNTTSDPFMSLSLRIEVEPARFFRNINSALHKIKILSGKQSYRDTWSKLRLNAIKTKESLIFDSSWSEIKAFSFILNNIPQSYNLFLSNGTAIRYAQIIKYKLPHASYCNRGVSGIDGSVSTAIGGALAFRGKTILVTGDLSLAYDIGALSLKNIPDTFKIIVIDNQGGGIFRFIPSTRDLEEREEYLCQTPLLPLKHLAEGYGWNYFGCDDEKSLQISFTSFLNSPRKAILKLTCDGNISADILKSYMSLKINKI